MKRIFFFFALVFSFAVFPGWKSRVVKNNFSVSIPVNCIDPANDTLYSDFAMLDTAVQHHRFFFAGEVHHVAVNPEIYLKLVKYLYFKAHVRYIVMEYGPSEAYLFQRYLDTGDENFVKDSWMFAFNEYVDFWRKLYVFNKNLKEKIHLIGVDFDSDHYFTKVVAYLFPKDSLPAQAIKPMLDSVMVVKDRIPFNTVDNKLIIRFKDDYLQHRAAYNAYFGQRIAVLNQLFDNEASYSHMNGRDYQMLYNFFAYGMSDNTSSYFGMFGKYHTSLYGNGTFAAMLNNGEMDQSFVNKVMSIYLIYDSCTTYYNYKLSRITPNDDFGLLSFKKNMALLKYFRENSSCSNALFGLRISENEDINGLSEETNYVLYLKNHSPVTLNPDSKKYFPKAYGNYH